VRVVLWDMAAKYGDSYEVSIYISVLPR